MRPPYFACTVWYCVTAVRLNDAEFKVTDVNWYKQLPDFINLTQWRSVVLRAAHVQVVIQKLNFLLFDDAAVLDIWFPRLPQRRKRELWYYDQALISFWSHFIAQQALSWFHRQLCAQEEQMKLVSIVSVSATLFKDKINFISFSISTIYYSVWHTVSFVNIE